MQSISKKKYRQEFRSLARRYLAGKATVGEQSFFENYYAYFATKEQEQSLITGLDLEKEMLTGLRKKIGSGSILLLVAGKRRLIIPAAAILVLSLGLVFFYTRHDNNSKTSNTTGYSVVDKAPGNNKALLILDDGSTIQLDSMPGSNLSLQENIALKIQNGTVSYSASKPISKPAYNIISIPQGGQYRLILADGSKVWLNASSSLRYPVAFTGNERRVELTGEAYFEITGNKDLPFKIAVAGQEEVEVTGTRFNINAYDDEAGIKTDLLEGKLKVTSLAGTKKSENLSAGQQAALNPDGHIIIKQADMEAAAWKDGFFHFESADLKSILRQFSRWYNVEVVYESEINNQRYFMISSKKSPLSEVLKALQTNEVSFKITADKLLVRGTGKQTR